MQFVLLAQMGLCRAFVDYTLSLRLFRFVRHRTLYHSVSNKQQEFQENEYDTSLHMWNPINNLQFYLPQINGMNLDKYSTDIIHICMIRFLVHATIAVRH